MRKASKDKREKKEKKENKEKKAKKFGNMPKKVFKKLLRKEMERQYQQIYNEPSADHDQIDSDSQPQSTHNRVACDGCSVDPIVGIRYKCSVCKDFDFC